MLKLFATSLLLTLAMASESSTSESSSTEYTKQNRDSVSCNYYYASFDGSSFAFATNQCTQYSILNGLYMNATCLDANHLQANIYHSSSCTGTPYSNNIYTSENATFFCGGVNGYASIQINIAACPAKYTVYSAINTCTNATTMISSSVYCSGSYGEIQYYKGDQCGDEYFDFLSSFNTSCGYLFTSLATGAKIYGKLVYCSLDGSPATTTTTSAVTTTKGSSSDANIFNMNYIAMFFMMLFAALQH